MKKNPEDFDLRFRQLLEALDLPSRIFSPEDDPIDTMDPEDIGLIEEKFGIREPDRIKRRYVQLGRMNYSKGKRFEDEVAALYCLLALRSSKTFKSAVFRLT